MLGMKSRAMLSISKCFRHVGMYPSTMDLDDDDDDDLFACEVLLDLKAQVQKVPKKGMLLSAMTQPPIKV